MDINLNAGDSTGMEQDQNAMIRKMLMESMREEFELKFNRKQSIYKKEETCKKAHAATGSYTATTATQKDSGY